MEEVAEESRAIEGSCSLLLNNFTVFLVGIFCSAISITYMLRAMTMAEGYMRAMEITRYNEAIARDENTLCAAQRAHSLRARYIYGFMFFTAITFAWLVRDYGNRFLPDKGACGLEGNKCAQSGGVLRVSLGCFMFFSFMSMTTFSIHKLRETRNLWHSSWWPLKLVAYVFCIVIPFFVPENIIQLYGEVARVGAGIFLLLQLLSLVQFLTWCNDKWPLDPQSTNCGLVGLFFSTILYIASSFGVVLIYYIYATNSSCTFNIFFILCTAVLVQVMMLVSLHSKVNKGLLSSGIMGCYVVFLCWSAIQSEPYVEKCQARKKMIDGSDMTTIVSFFLAISVIAVTTFSTGKDSQAFKVQLRMVEMQSEDDIPYKYETFHFVFSMGAMYFGMLLISWELNQPTKRWRIDVGWASTWIKIANQWFAVILYLWKLISDAATRNSDARHEHLRSTC